jgi:hypothetical protein
MKLPNGERADLGTKIEEYVLNPQHREGRHKARVFESVLGITLDTQNVLRQAILVAAAESEQVEARGDNGHGEVYVLRFPLETAAGRAIVLTAWIVRRREDFPRLTTCYIV